MKIYSRIFILSLLIHFSATSDPPCKESDYKQYFSDCDAKDEKRTVTIYLSSQCENSQLENNTVLGIYSTLPTYTIPCTTKCNSGEYVSFDVLKKKTVCLKCPEDTYSQGGNFKITSNWNHETIKKNFVINCYSIDSTSFKKNANCTHFNVLSDKSMMTSGELTGQQLKYLFELIYFFKSKNNGRVIIKYKKDREKENGFNNGDLKIFFDYQHIGGDTNGDSSSIKTIYHDFGPGDHELVFFYNYYKINDKSLKLYIQSIEVIGIDDACYHCEKCIDSIAPEGSDQCITCQNNHYFDKALQECKECPSDEFSVANSISNNSCNKRKECTEYDYYLTKFNQCNSNHKRTVELSLIQPSYCLSQITSGIMTKEVDCILQNNSNSSEVKCQEGMGLITNFQIDFSSGKIEELFRFNYGWSSNGNKLFVGTYLSNINDKLLRLEVKKATSSSFASAKISFEVKLTQNEFFKIKINYSIIKVYFNVNKTDTIEVVLNESDNNIEFIYQKIGNQVKYENPVSITKIELLGSNLSTNKICKQCPLDSISQTNSNTCIKCKETEIPNSKQTECIPCSNGIRKIINGKIHCSNCPSYTSFNGAKCILNEIIHQKEEKLKFNLAPMKDWLKKLCEDQSGVLCYENAFIGPINSQTTNSTAHDIFFISLFEPKKIEVYDFTYDDITNAIKEGHIFGLFSVDKLVLNSSNSNKDIFIDHNITYQNTKTKKNIGKAIQNVYLLGKSINSSKRLGSIIEFEQGDTCISDPSKRYKAYVYLKCEKYQISAPKIVNTTDNGCTIIFEWNSPYLCKNCLTKEIHNFERGTCKNGRRQIIFSSNDECLIFNATNPKLLGNDKDFDDALLSEKDEVYKLVLNSNSTNRDVSVVVVEDGDSVSFPFDYIENRTYYETCSFIDNIESSWKKYLLIIPIVYLITCILVICYCCKYKKIKNEYERIRSMDMSHHEISKEKDKEEIKKKDSKNLDIDLHS